MQMILIRGPSTGSYEFRLKISLLCSKIGRGFDSEIKSYSPERRGFFFRDKKILF